MTKESPYEGWGEGHEEQLVELDEALEAGEVRKELSCEEARREWFVMARTMYVNNNPQPRIPLDFEIGVHLGGCLTPPCQALANAYSEILRPSHPDSAELLSATLDDLEKQVFADQN
ncbi:MAG TPA: hypothetical protein VJJ78_00635 [Candidatus Saccharimonadales bacterium]|nr:hypothetical protein [Candidatus Saccharimonadales bacterium]